METLLETEQLRISSVREPSASCAVIAFAGVGHALGGIPLEEFGRSLKNAGSHRDLYFVVDKKRGWYNDTSDLILSTLESTLNGCPSVTLGNSMGGFGAIFFAPLLTGCMGSVAFSPQFSVDPRILPAETRWSVWTDAVKEWKVPTCVPSLGSRLPHCLVFGADDADDSKHIRHFQEARDRGIGIMLVAGADHNVAGYLRDRGVLVPLLNVHLDDPTKLDDGQRLLIELGFDCSSTAP